MHVEAALKKSLIGVVMGAEKLLRGKPACSPGDLSRFRDFLFLQYMMPLGYCVHDTPIYEALRACMPDARITVATRRAGYETLRHNPFINALISTADPLTETLQAARELKAGLRRTGAVPDCGVTNFSNARTRITLLNMLAGRHVRLGHTLAPGLYHLPQKYDRNESLIDNNLCLVANFGCAIEHVEPRVFFNQREVDRIADLLQARNIDRTQSVTVMVTQNSGGQRTGWQSERFAEVIRCIGKKSQLVFVGTGADASAIDSLRTQAGQEGALASTSLAGLTTIPELSALLCVADCAVSLDTGTMHVGRAAGVPMVVLGPSWQKPLEWLPLGRERVRILRGEDIDHAPTNYQLDEIEPHSVIAAFEELHTLYPPSDLERSARLRKSLSTVDHGTA